MNYGVQDVSQPIKLLSTKPYSSQWVKAPNSDKTHLRIHFIVQHEGKPKLFGVGQRLGQEIQNLKPGTVFRLRKETVSIPRVRTEIKATEAKKKPLHESDPNLLEQLARLVPNVPLEYPKIYIALERAKNKNPPTYRVEQ